MTWFSSWQANWDAEWFGAADVVVEVLPPTATGWPLKSKRVRVKRRFGWAKDFPPVDLETSVMPARAFVTRRAKAAPTPVEVAASFQDAEVLGLQEPDMAEILAMADALELLD